MTPQIHDDWRITTPPPGLKAFTYNLSLDNGHCKRMYVGSSTFRANWELYSGSGKLVNIWHTIYGQQGTKKYITGLYEHKHDAEIAEVMKHDELGIPNNPRYLNLVAGYGKETRHLHRHEINILTVNQMAGWEPIGDKPFTVIVANTGVFGFPTTTKAAECFSMTPCTVSNLASGRRRSPARQDIHLVRYMSRRLVDYVPYLMWWDGK